MFNILRRKPLLFYDFFITFFAVCTVYDLYNQTITGFTWGWVFCLGYYIYRRKCFQEELLSDEEDRLNDHDT